jgi:hypothetical protein
MGGLDGAGFFKFSGKSFSEKSEIFLNLYKKFHTYSFAWNFFRIFPM